ncbi:MAG: twin-arginine translocation signal domain-containing protein, partial [Gemmata sp.]
MHPALETLLQNRRDFLATSANGVGLLALASLLQSEGRLGAAGGAAGQPHFAPAAKS